MKSEEYRKRRQAYIDEMRRAQGLIILPKKETDNTDYSILKKEFRLDKAMEGYPCLTRDGRRVMLTEFKPDNKEFCIEGRVEDMLCNRVTWNIDGVCNSGYSEDDLVMTGEPPFKDGDYISGGEPDNNSFCAIFREGGMKCYVDNNGHPKIMFKAHALLQNWDDCWANYPIELEYWRPLRRATEKEIQNLKDGLWEKGLRWDDEKKEAIQEANFSRNERFMWKSCLGSDGIFRPQYKERTVEYCDCTGPNTIGCYIKMDDDISWFNTKGGCQLRCNKMNKFSLK